MAYKKYKVGDHVFTYEHLGNRIHDVVIEDTYEVDGVPFYTVVGNKLIIKLNTCFVDTNKKRLMKRYLGYAQKCERESEIKLHYHRIIRKNVEEQLELLKREEDANKQGYPF